MKWRTIKGVACNQTTHQPVIIQGQPCKAESNPYLKKILCNSSILPETDEAKELLELFDQLCDAFDPNYDPSLSTEPLPGTPNCIPDCLPANPELEVITNKIADILEL